ncbi:ECA1 gametogenesis related family [Medicago truncatula]|uniref:ECA1 gametogenesis related family n=1 Tax=Medicago truncatula TaxID=3880 RepID=G7J194_MEDTR|nr:ECA1 gametogenesis related family [Medicago truncatula]
MASSHKIFVLVALALVFIALNSSTSIVESRKLSNPNSNLMSLEARLKHVVGEIVTFFLNGETYLGYGCCKAIRVIGHDCWPNVVASLGFTNEETDVLEGYCDQVEDVHSPPSPPTPLVSFVDPKDIIP